MTERKPGDVPFETWIERQIREAQDRGEFDDLPGAGKPIPRDSALDGDDWWIRRKMEREGLKYPNAADDAEERIALMRERACNAPTDAQAIAIVKAVNREIHTMRINPPPGRPLILRLVEVDEVLRYRRAHRRRTGPDI